MLRNLFFGFWLSFLLVATAQAATPTTFSCAGLQLGEPESAVEAALGKPLYLDDEIVFGCPVKYYAYAENVFVGVSQQNHQIVDIKSYDKKYGLNKNWIAFGDTAYHVLQLLGKQPITRINGQQYLIYPLPRQAAAHKGYLLLQINNENSSVEGVRLTVLPLDSEMALDNSYWQISASNKIADADLDTSAVLRPKANALPQLQFLLHN